MAEVLQRTLDPRVAPRGILRRHPNHQYAEVSLQSGTPGTDARISPLAGHQLTMPSKNGVGRHDARDLPKHPTPEQVPQFCEAAPLGIIESQSPPRSEE